MGLGLFARLRAGSSILRLVDSDTAQPGRLCHQNLTAKERRSPQVDARTVGAQAPHLPQAAQRWALLPSATCHLPLPLPTASLGLDYAVSCGLQSVAQHLLHSGFLRTIPRGFALAFSSWLSMLTMSPSRYSHRGLPPHKFAPKLGAHHSLKQSANGRPPGPGRWSSVHFHRPGPGVLPSSPASSNASPIITRADSPESENQNSAC